MADWRYDVPRRLLATAATAGTAAIIILTLVPGDLRPHVSASDHLEHVLAYGAVMGAFALSVRRPAHAVLPLLALTAVAGLGELAQAFVQGRQAEIADFAWSVFGALAGSAAAIGRQPLVRLAIGLLGRAG